MNYLQKCHFLFALPASRKSFDNDLESANKDFVRSNASNKNLDKFWRQYDEEVLTPYFKFKKKYVRHGVSVTEEAHFSNFKNTIKSFDHEAITLFSHTQGDGENEKIEFFDGMITAARIAEAYPLVYDKILDLTVCHANTTQEMLEQKCRNMVVLWHKKEIYYKAAWQFLDRLYEKIALENMTYIKAYTKTITEL